MIYPHCVLTGYPPKEFRFSGEFELIAPHTGATRNKDRKTVKAPIFISADGERVVMMQFAEKL